MTDSNEHSKAAEEARLKAAAERTKDEQATHDSLVNADPITGEPGAHPLGTGAGAAGMATAGAAIGTAVGGPVGFAVGGVVGAIVGGLAGKGIAESVNPTEEDLYWREHYGTRPYYMAETPYDMIQPAYAHGWEARDRYKGQQWDDIEEALQEDWERSQHAKSMPWVNARPATHDAWDRLNG
jgi:hypothetical protein